MKVRFLPAKGKKVSRFYQEDTIANGSYRSSTGVLMISLVILSISIFSAMQKLLGVCCDSLGKCCQQKAEYNAVTTLHGISWLAVNPALFFIPFLEKVFFYLLFFPHLSGVTQAPMEFYMVSVVTNGQKSTNMKGRTISALCLA